MTKLRKFFASSVMVMTVVVMSGLTAPVMTNAAASAGDLIKKDGLSAVYYLGEDGKRYVFPNEATYKSWYSDFSGVVTISADELASYPLGGNVVVRPGTKLVKITTDPKVYAVEANGTLRWVQTEADAIALFGANWAQRVIDVADSFFTNYTIGTALTSGQVPAGSLVQKTGESSIYYYDGVDYRLIENEVAFSANRFQFTNVLTLGSFTASGSTITGAEASIIKTSQTATTGPVITGSGLAVALNSMTPVAQEIPGNSHVEFLKLNFTAANDGPINISSIKLTAYGLSDTGNINDVTFYDNGVKVGSDKDINTSREALFNFSTPVYVAAGTTKTLTVKATIGATTGTYALGIASASDVTSSGATVTGSFPITGNTMSAVNASASLGSMTIDASGNASATASFGEDNVLLADFTLASGSSEDSLLESIRLYNGGTNNNAIVSNLKLFIDGEEVSSGTYADRYATFALNNYEIEKGDTVSVEVKGDIGTTASSDTIKFYLKDLTDLVSVGKTLGFGLAVTNTGSDLISATAAGVIQVTLSAGDFTIDMDKTSTTGTPAKDVKPGDKRVTLATLFLTSNSENATIDSIDFNFTSGGLFGATNKLENVELVDVVTGGVYDMDADFIVTDDISVVKGVAKKFIVRADFLDTAVEGATYQVTLAGSNMVIEGDVSEATINNITPSTVASSIVTVRAAALDLSTTVLTNLSIVGGATDQVIYRALVKAGSADSVKIQSVKLTSATSSLATSAFTDSNISQLSLYLNGKLLKTVSNGIAGDLTTTNGTITFSSLNTSNYTVPANAEYVLEVKATFASTVEAGDFKLKVASTDDLVVKAVSNNDPVVPTANTTIYSRVVTAATVGTLNIALLVTDSKANRDSYLLAGSQTETNRYMGELQFTTAKEPVRVEKLTLTDAGTATNQDIKEIKLVNSSGSVVATQTVNSVGTAIWTNLNLTFPADQTTSLFIVAVANGMNVDADPTSTARDGYTVRYSIAAGSTITAFGVNSGSEITETATGTGNSKTATIVGSKLNSVTNAMSDGSLVGGSNKIIGKYTLVFDNGSNRNLSNAELKAILATTTVKVAKSDTVGITAVQMYVEGQAASVAAATGDEVGTSTATLTFTAAQMLLLADSGQANGTLTLVITGTVAPSSTVGEYVQTYIEDLNGAGGDHITYISNGEDDGTALSNMLLPVIRVDGATLSE
ncbi:MAG: hypothetical protein WC928_03715 [Patescibacteria group bacterium]|jgi:hypothetical protein